MHTFSTKIRCITRRFACLLVLLILLLVPLLAACGPSSSAQQTASTPTPLPVAPALERSTYIVQRGPMEQLLEVTGRVTPVDLQQLSFKVEGRVVNVKAKRGDPVKAGDVLAELELDDALDTLRQAEYALAQAQRDLEDARHSRKYRSSKLSCRSSKHKKTRFVLSKSRPIGSSKRKTT
jgi:multidrug efflux pump subunit AcrA (membrane-fusion protein)